MNIGRAVASARYFISVTVTQYTLKMRKNRPIKMERHVATWGEVSNYQFLMATNFLNNWDSPAKTPPHMVKAKVSSTVLLISLYSTIQGDILLRPLPNQKVMERNGADLPVLRRESSGVESVRCPQAVAHVLATRQLVIGNIYTVETFAGVFLSKLLSHALVTR